MKGDVSCYVLGLRFRKAYAIRRITDWLAQSFYFQWGRISLPKLYGASKENTSMIRVFIGCSNKDCARELMGYFKIYLTNELTNPYCSNCNSVIERVIVRERENA